MTRQIPHDTQTDAEDSQSSQQDVPPGSDCAGEAFPTATRNISHRLDGRVDADLHITAGTTPPSEFCKEVVTSDSFIRHLTDAVRTVVAGVPHHRRLKKITDCGVTAGECGYARLVVGLERGPESRAYERAVAVTGQFGQHEDTPFGHRLSVADLVDGPLALFDTVDESFSIDIRIGEEFRDRRRDQREDICKVISVLSIGCDVSIVTTGRTARWLVNEHGDSLPPSFSFRRNTGSNSSPISDEQISELRNRFDADGRHVCVLRQLAAEPAQTLSYHELRSQHDVSKARISQVISDLVDAELVERYGSPKNRQIDLKQSGVAFINYLNEKTGRQQTLDEAFSWDGQSQDRTCYSKSEEDNSPSGPVGSGASVADASPPEPYHTRYTNRAEQIGASAAATTGDIVLVEAPLPDVNKRTRFVSYDEERKEAVVAVRATSPLQCMTSFATGLSSGRLLGKCLPEGSLEDVDVSREILRGARCIGALSDEAFEDTTLLQNNLTDWAEHIERLTRKWKYGEYEDRTDFWTRIVQSAHGLTTTVVHLLDALGINVIREIRVPSIGGTKIEKLARTVAISAAKQSKYGAFAVWRQLYEERDRKRKDAITPTVDAKNPTGEMIGSIVIRGPRASHFEDCLERQLSSPWKLHEDAPEFTVSVDVATPRRETFTAAVNRMLSEKNIRATPEAVTLFEALTGGDPYAVTAAIQRLQPEDETRRIHLDEVRFSLSKLDTDRLLPSAPPTVSKMLSALLRSSCPLSREELTERADVSSRSVRRHIETLTALDIVRETENGLLRLSLSFNSERRDSTQIKPKTLEEETSLEHLVFDIVISMIDRGEAGRLGDPSNPLGSLFFGPSLDLVQLRQVFPNIRPYLFVAESFCDERERAEETRTFEFGKTATQQSVQSGSVAVPS